MDDNELRTNAILRDIYNRHGVPEDQQNPLAATAFLEKKHAEEARRLTGSSDGKSAWANPQERAQGRKDYALKGVDPGDTESRWQRSRYLMDPVTAKMHQSIGRDKDFVTAIADAPDVTDAHPQLMSQTPDEIVEPAALEKGMRDAALWGALNRWDRSGKEGSLHRTSWVQPNTLAGAGVSGGLANAITNRDSEVGRAFAFNELPFEYLTSRFSGENSDPSLVNTALTAASPLLGALHSQLGGGQPAHVGPLGSYLHEGRYRLSNPGGTSPVLDLPAGATPQERSERLHELDSLQETAAQPEALERWQRTTGWAPSPALADAGDALLSMADFTLPFSLGGKGWLKGLIREAGQEQVANAGILGALPGNPDRTYAEYLFGTGEAPEIKTPEQVAEARAARQRLYDENGGMLGMLLNDSVSQADGEAYNELNRAGRMPFWSRSHKVHP
jgi:hypothetical protein